MSCAPLVLIEIFPTDSRHSRKITDVYIGIRKHSQLKGDQCMWEEVRSTQGKEGQSNNDSAKNDDTPAGPRR